MGNLEIFLRAVEDEKKKFSAPVLVQVRLSADFLSTSVYYYYLPPFLQQETDDQKALRIRTSCQNVQAFSADDGAIALDNEAGQWRLLQGNPEWLDGIFRKERFLCD